MNSETPRRSTRLHPKELLLGLENKSKRIRTKSIIDQNLIVNEMANGNETIEELRSEIIRLRQLNNAQNRQLAEIHRNNDNVQENNDNQLIRTLIDGLRTMNIDVKAPRFDENENPSQFIERLEKFIL